MASSSAGEKTEDPTPKRREQARKEGQIAKSQELVTWAAMLLGSMALPMTLRRAHGEVVELFARAADVIADPTPAGARAVLGTGLAACLTSVLPLALTMAAFAIIANIAQTKAKLATKKLKPNPGRLNPLKGIKQLFSPQSAWNAAKELLRVVVLAVAAYVPLRATITVLATADRPPLLTMLGDVASEAMAMVRIVCVAGLLLGLIDYVVVRKQHNKQLRMTKQEVKDEGRQAEGDPQVKGQIRAKQREMSRNRMLAGVGDASVVIVNPVHVAVALRYDEGGGAPRLIAKGKGEIARRIRERAEEHRVPIVRDIPLAWALHDTVELDHPVPPDLYAAVAKVLAFVMTVGKRAAALGGAVSVPA